MKPHPRIRKTVKWGGAALTVLLAAAWAWSMVFVYFTDGSGRVSVFLRHGLLLVATHEPREQDSEATLYTWYSLDQRSMWVPAGGGSPSGGWYVIAPVPILASASMLAAIAAWRLDTLARRRARLNLCPSCTYDRSGLAVGAVCPECGRPPA